jgi:hypothetical protein
LNATTHAGWFALAPRRSAAGTTAVTSIGLPGEVEVGGAAGTYVVASVVATLFASIHWTTVQGRILLPCTVIVKFAVPAGEVFGVTEIPAGVGSPTDGVDSVNVFELDAPTEFDTVTVAVPGNAASVAEMEAVSCVALTKVVAR